MLNFHLKNQSSQHFSKTKALSLLKEIWIYNNLQKLRRIRFCKSSEDFLNIKSLSMLLKF